MDEPVVQPFRTVGKAEGREQVERHRGQDGQNDADGAESKADAAERDEKGFFEVMHNRCPFCGWQKWADENVRVY